MKVLVTGATGYIGHKLAIAAVQRGFRVHILVRDLESPYLPRHENIRTFRGDITDKESLRVAMHGCDCVLHAAAVTKLYDPDPDVFYKVNVEGTRNVLDTALSLGVKKLVFTSTGAVIGPSGKFPMTENDPRIVAFENDYEISKHCAEELVKEYSRKGLFALIVSAPRVFGPGPFTTGNVFDRLISRILAMKIAFVPRRDNFIGNYAFVDDVVNGHFLAMQKGLGGEKYILGGENLSYHTFFTTLQREAGVPVRLIHVPHFLLISWSFLHMMIHRLLGKSSNVSPKVIRRIMQNRALSSEKAIRQLGYAITPFPEGMRKTIYHLKKQPHD